MSDPLFCGTELAARIETAEAQLIAAGTDAALRRDPDRAFVTPVAGGFACFGEDGAPFNKVVGLGFGGVPSEAALDEIEAAYAARGAPTQVELTNLADPEIGVRADRPGLPARRVRERARHDRWTPTRRNTADADGVDIREAEKTSSTPGSTWWSPGSPTRRAGRRHRTRTFPARSSSGPNAISSRQARGPISHCRDGVVAGGGGLRITDGVAQLVGAATAPEHRRRGVQSALLSTRLADAAEAGCDIAVVTTAPGSKSQQNVQRQGFELLYTRAVLVK